MQKYTCDLELLSNIRSNNYMLPFYLICFLFLCFLSQRIISTTITTVEIIAATITITITAIMPAEISSRKHSVHQ